MMQRKKQKMNICNLNKGWNGSIETNTPQKCKSNTQSHYNNGLLMKGWETNNNANNQTNKLNRSQMKHTLALNGTKQAKAKSVVTAQLQHKYLQAKQVQSTSKAKQHTNTHTKCKCFVLLPKSPCCNTKVRPKCHGSANVNLISLEHCHFVRERKRGTIAIKMKDERKIEENQVVWKRQ